MAAEDLTGQRAAVATDRAPSPAGHYSQAIAAAGLVWVSGQTPRYPDGTRALDQPFEVQAKLALENLAAVADKAGSSLDHAVHVNVYLRDPSNAGRFNEIYRNFVKSPTPPARTLVQSSLAIGEVEIDAVLISQS